MERRAWHAPAGWALVLACAATTRAEGPVLHEYVPDVAEDEASALIAGGNDEPAAILYGGEVLAAPDATEPLRSDERAMKAPPTVGGLPAPSFRPDRVTELESTLGYYAAFTPTIAPFKRVTALDRVELAPDGTPVLVVDDPTPRPIPVEVTTDAAVDGLARDRFWGNVVLDFSSGRRVELPSVSPASRVLSLRTEPAVRLRIEKNGAQSYFAVLEGNPGVSRVRAVFLMDAPRPYFNAPIPDVPSDWLASEVPPMPARVRRSAERFAGELGIGRGDPLPRVLSVLTEHFRSFTEAREPPTDSGDIFLDLARAKKGVCRHRAYAFVIAAQALGVPAHFVYNEAHSWVEVKMPEVGWMRIDLGGAAQGLDARGALDRPVYQPAAPDPLPRPREYLESYSQLPSGGVSGLRLAGDRTDRSSAGATATPGADGPRAQDGTPWSERAAAVAQPGGGVDASLRPLVLNVDQRRYDVFRGRLLEVSGRATEAGGAGVEGLRIEVLLQGRRELLLGVTVSREHGWFRGSFGIPPDVEVGDYRLVVRTPGDERYAPAMAR